MTIQFFDCRNHEQLNFSCSTTPRVGEYIEVWDRFSSNRYDRYRIGLIIHRGDLTRVVCSYAGSAEDNGPYLAWPNLPLDLGDR